MDQFSERRVTIKHYHFIGIGGIGVGALAALSLDKGCRVSGSDLRRNQVTESLEARGAVVFIGHDAANVGNADCVVYSSAVPDDNPEMEEARRRGIPVMQRARLLAELMEGYTRITVAGAHGKTTTTSMAATLLAKAGLAPTTAVGGLVVGSHAHASLGTGKYFVAEVDESDGSFLYFAPHYSIITNIDFEHVDRYRNWSDVLGAYRSFIGRTTDGGVIIACGDDVLLREILHESGRIIRTYGFDGSNDVRASGVAFDGFTSCFECAADGKLLGSFTLNVPGPHNVANALACIALGLSLGIDADVIRSALREYHGVQRRFQLKARAGGVYVIDDYAHHPTEIRATLQTAERFVRTQGGGRLITVFQPHRYSRLAGLMDDFAGSFGGSDHIVVTDIYAASELPIEGVNAQVLCAHIRAKTNKPVEYVEKERLTGHVMGIVQQGDLVLTIGAGDITRVSDELAAMLKKHAEANV